MKIGIAFALISLLTGAANALPNAILGFLAKHESSLNDQDLTDILLAGAVWDGSKPLPGEWEADAGVANASAAYLMARPRVFGEEALLVRALHRKDQLAELQITFADAGSFFGYLDRTAPEGMSKEDAMTLLQKRVTEKQSEFSKKYRETSETLIEHLEKIDARPKTSKRGRTRDLRAEFQNFQFKKNGLIIQLLEAPDRLLRVNIRRENATAKTWLDSGLEELSQRERLNLLSKNVTTTTTGDTIVGGIEVVPQGYRPYCGLNTLVMVARYLGLHLDEDWLAVAGKFQNTGSAAGSDMLGLYGSVAREARINLQRANSYDHETIRRSIRAGMPVIVWRRWDANRDQLHTKTSRAFTKDPQVRYARPEENSLPSKKKNSPVHASVIIGYNDERQEIIFLESWDQKSLPRRMPVSEISHTSDFTFSFKP